MARMKRIYELLEHFEELFPNTEITFEFDKKRFEDYLVIIGVKPATAADDDGDEKPVNVE